MQGGEAAGGDDVLREGRRVGGGGLQSLLVARASGDDLQPYRQSILGMAAGHRGNRQADDAEGIGEAIDVVVARDRLTPPMMPTASPKLACACPGGCTSGTNISRCR